MAGSYLIPVDEDVHDAEQVQPLHVVREADWTGHRSPLDPDLPILRDELWATSLKAYEALVPRCRLGRPSGTRSGRLRA